MCSWCPVSQSSLFGAGRATESVLPASCPRTLGGQREAEDPLPQVPVPAGGQGYAQDVRVPRQRLHATVCSEGPEARVLVRRPTREVSTPFIERAAGAAGL